MVGWANRHILPRKWNCYHCITSATRVAGEEGGEVGSGDKMQFWNEG